MHSEQYSKGKIKIIAALSFLLGFFDGFLIYILSGYFSLVSGPESVGIFYFVAYFLVLLSLLYLQGLVRLIGQARALYLCLGFTILGAALLAQLSASWLTVGIIVGFIVATNVIWVTLDMILESFSKDQMSGRIRGSYLSIMSAGILLAPSLSTWTLERYDYSGVFFVLLVGYILIFLIALLSFRHDNVVTQARHKFWETFVKVKKEVNLRHIYVISFAMEFFYAIILVYVPLYLRSLGFSWTELGTIFTFMLLPFVVLQYPLGRVADRWWGEKELLGISIFIALIATAALPFIQGAELVVWGGVLFLTRVGIAGIEVLRDSYFYKQIDHTELDVIAFFRTARPIANILGAAAAFFFLLHFPLRGIFFLSAIVFLVSFFSVFCLIDTQSEREKALS